MEIGILVYYISSIIEKITRLFDLVASGSFTFYDPDLHTINGALNDELTNRIRQLNQLRGNNDIEPFIPYPRFDIEEVLQTWYKEKRPELRKLDFRIKIATKTGGSNLLPPECIAFMHQIGQEINTYQLKKYEFELQQFRTLYDNSRQNEEAKNKLNEHFDIDFLKNREVRVVLEQYFEEFKQSFFTNSIRAPIILCGAILEALLIEAIQLDEENAVAQYKKSHSDTRDIERWKFEDLINVALQIGIIPTDLEKQTDVIRDLRNFIHVHRAVRSGLQLDTHYKELCKNALFIVVNEVKRWHGKHQ